MDDRTARAIAKQFYRLNYAAKQGSEQEKRDAGLAAAQEFLSEAAVRHSIRMSEEIEKECLLPRVISFGRSQND